MATKCNICNKRRNYTGTGPGVDVAPHGSDMCNYCYTEGGWENTHNDYGHEAIKKIVEHAGDAQLSDNDKAELSSMAQCWFCHPELNLAQKPVKTQATGPKAKYDRRPQLNHKGHSHPATPAARRACKMAFWAEVAKGLPKTKDMVMFMTEWDHLCDGFGKPVELPKTKQASMTIVPRGPKGGVINQLKKGKPQA